MVRSGISFVFVLTIGLSVLTLIGCAGSPGQGGMQEETKPKEVDDAAEISKSSGSPLLPWSSGNLRIGYIRSDVIAKELTDYKDADNQLKSKNRDWLEQAEEMEKEIKNLEAESEELGIILSAERMKELEKRIADARKALRSFKQKTWYDENSTYIKRRKELMEPIDAKVNDAIWKVAEDADMDLILDTVAGNIVYVKPEFDLTERVLEELKE